MTGILILLALVQGFGGRVTAGAIPILPAIIDRFLSIGNLLNIRKLCHGYPFSPQGKDTAVAVPSVISSRLRHRLRWC